MQQVTRKDIEEVVYEFISKQCDDFVFNDKLKNGGRSMKFVSRFPSMSKQVSIEQKLQEKFPNAKVAVYTIANEMYSDGYGYSYGGLRVRVAMKRG